MEPLAKVHVVAVRILRNRVVMVGHHLRQDNLHVAALRRVGKRVRERVVGRRIRPQQELALRAPARDEQKVTREYGPWCGHAESTSKLLAERKVLIWRAPER
jgi:hypothetical protein